MSKDKFDESIIALTERYKELFTNPIPKPVKRRKSFLEIGSVPHYEQVISNFYRFYLDKKEEHGFKELFLNSLLDLIEKKTDREFNFYDYEVYTEVTTKGGGRIDILIKDEDETKGIIIENKINHTLNNDLEDYWNSIKAKAKNKIGIVLSLEKIETNNKNFINITHKEFIKTIKSQLGDFLKDSDDRHLLFLKDLFENINNLTFNKLEMKDTLKFYMENNEKIHELEQIMTNARKHFYNSVKEASSLIKFEIENSNPKIYRCLIISKRPSIRLWIQLNQTPDDDFLEIYLDFVGKTIIHSDKIIENPELISKYTEIDFEGYPEASGGKSVASKDYNPDTNEFLELGKYLAEIIKKDWLPLIEDVKQIIKIS